jgi:hypothetical protein
VVQILQTMLEAMLESMHHAMLIYLYRRIYDVQASMLQGSVIAVRDCLQICESANGSAFYGSAGFAWTAFIAACEAEGIDLQRSFTTWYEIAAQRAGLASFTESLETVNSVWREKRALK